MNMFYSNYGVVLVLGKTCAGWQPACVHVRAGERVRPRNTGVFRGRVSMPSTGVQCLVRAAGLGNVDDGTRDDLAFTVAIVIDAPHQVVAREDRNGHPDEVGAVPADELARIGRLRC